MHRLEILNRNEVSRSSIKTISYRRLFFESSKQYSSSAIFNSSANEILFLLFNSQVMIEDVVDVVVAVGAELNR